MSNLTSDIPPQALLNRLANPDEGSALRACGACKVVNDAPITAHTFARKVHAHLTEVLKELDSIKHDAAALNILSTYIEDIQAASEDVGEAATELHTGFGHFQKWISKQLDKCEWRKWNPEPGEGLRPEREE